MQDINMNIAVFDHRSVCVPGLCCLLGNKAQFTVQVLLCKWWFADMFLQSLVFLLRVCLKQWGFKCEIETARIVSTQVFWQFGSEFSNLLTNCSRWTHSIGCYWKCRMLWPGKQHVVNRTEKNVLNKLFCKLFAWIRALCHRN